MSYIEKIILLLILLCAGCAKSTQIQNMPEEVALPVSQAQFWTDISAIQSEDWFHLLNKGDKALEWRLRMIDSARVSIDLETFLWKL